MTLGLGQSAQVAVHHELAFKRATRLPYSTRETVHLTAQHIINVTGLIAVTVNLRGKQTLGL